MKFLPKRLPAIVGSATMLAFAIGFAPAGAQQTAPTEPPASAPAQIDDATLQAFAQATLDVETVVDKWTPRIEQAETSEEVQQMRRTGSQEITQVVQENGLEMETYNQLYQVVQTNPDVAMMVQRYRQELQ